MFIVDLTCKNEHRFEGWYDSDKHYYNYVQNQMLTCPICGSHAVSRETSLWPPANKRASLHSPFIRLKNSFKAAQSPTIDEQPMTVFEERAIARILSKIREIQSKSPNAEKKIKSMKLVKKRSPKPKAVLNPPLSHTPNIDIEGIPYFKAPASDWDKN